MKSKLIKWLSVAIYWLLYPVLRPLSKSKRKRFDKARAEAIKQAEELAKVFKVNDICVVQYGTRFEVGTRSHFRQKAINNRKKALKDKRITGYSVDFSQSLIHVARYEGANRK